ncbi:MAG: methyltransferase domain-containing protein [Planctomycetota bacterium]
MAPPLHPVDQLSDEELRNLLLRVDSAGFPAKLPDVWRAERVRFRETLRRVPPAKQGNERLLDLGSSRAWLPFYQLVLGYRRIVLNTSYPDSGFVREGTLVAGADPCDVRVSVFDVERQRFPHEDESFDVVLCLEVLEHLAIDPMAMIAEVNRVLKLGGRFILTTPNAVRVSNVVNMILGEHPYGWSAYNGHDGNRHNREYTPGEVGRLLEAGGFNPAEVSTFGTKSRGPGRDLLRKMCEWALLPVRRCPRSWRRDVILAGGRKTSTQIVRRPGWLYFDMAERKHLREPRETLHDEGSAATSGAIEVPQCCHAITAGHGPLAAP